MTDIKKINEITVFVFSSFSLRCILITSSKPKSKRGQFMDHFEEKQREQLIVVELSAGKHTC